MESVAPSYKRSEKCRGPQDSLQDLSRLRDCMPFTRTLPACLLQKTWVSLGTGTATGLSSRFSCSLPTSTQSHCHTAFSFPEQILKGKNGATGHMETPSSPPSSPPSSSKLWTQDPSPSYLPHRATPYDSLGTEKNPVVTSTHFFVLNLKLLSLTSP